MRNLKVSWKDENFFFLISYLCFSLACTLPSDTHSLACTLPSDTHKQSLRSSAPCYNPEPPLLIGQPPLANQSSASVFFLFLLEETIQKTVQQKKCTRMYRDRSDISKLEKRILNSSHPKPNPNPSLPLSINAHRIVL